MSLRLKRKRFCSKHHDFDILNCPARTENASSAVRGPRNDVSPVPLSINYPTGAPNQMQGRHKTSSIAGDRLTKRPSIPLKSSRCISPLRKKMPSGESTAGDGPLPMVGRMIGWNSRFAGSCGLKSNRKENSFCDSSRRTAGVENDHGPYDWNICSEQRGVAGPPGYNSKTKQQSLSAKTSCNRRNVAKFVSATGVPPALKPRVQYMKNLTSSEKLLLLQNSQGFAQSQGKKSLENCFAQTKADIRKVTSACQNRKRVSDVINLTEIESSIPFESSSGVDEYVSDSGGESLALLEGVKCRNDDRSDKNSPRMITPDSRNRQEDPSNELIILDSSGDEHSPPAILKKRRKPKRSILKTVNINHPAFSAKPGTSVLFGQDWKSKLFSEEEVHSYFNGDPGVDVEAEHVVCKNKEQLESVRVAKLSNVPVGLEMDDERGLQALRKDRLLENGANVSTYEVCKGRIPQTERRERCSVPTSSQKRVLPPQGHANLLKVPKKPDGNDIVCVDLIADGEDKVKLTRDLGKDIANRERSAHLTVTKPEQDIRFRPLNNDERTELLSVTRKVLKNEVLAVIKEARIKLRGEDFACLRGSRWLNDEVMNSFVALINSRNRKFFQCRSEKGKDMPELARQQGRNMFVNDIRIDSCIGMLRPRTHVFNTFFVSRLSQGGYDFQGVRRWLVKAGQHLRDLDLVLAPINVSNFHWVLAAIDLRSQQFIYMDSMMGTDSGAVLQLLKQWLVDEVMDKMGDEVAEQMNIGKWCELVNPIYVPRQTDGGSCGVFTLYMAEYLERGQKPNFTQSDIQILRQRTVLFLKHGYLPS